MRIAFAALLCLLSAATALAQSSPQSVDGPGVRVGDTWIYNKLDGRKGTLDYVSVNTVVKVERDSIEMSSSSLDGRNVARIYRTGDFNLVRVDSPGYKSNALPYYPSYNFPLQVGKTWKRKVELSNSAKSDTTVNAELESRVAGWEMITVPAGNFVVLRIDTKGTYRASNFDGSWSGEIEDTLWYSPDARNAVRYVYKDTSGTTPYNNEIHELVRYWPGR